ncbi:condensation domain-containing protein, partial [Mycobacterium sp. E2462]|uniref:condensation domain-containing protein n=1 Tax=Mycobacterium sp. E2462 TaxID=1834133 RepID=UPI000A7270DD
PVRYLFEVSTVRDLADHLNRHRGGPARPPLVALPRPDRVPLSYAQQRLWFLNQFEDGAATYNMPTAFRFTGALNVEALAAALDDVIARHESLRTVFPDVDGVAQQQVLPAHAGLWRQEGAPTVLPMAEHDIAAALQDLAAYPFDLSVDVPIRAQLFSVGAGQHVLGIVLHHIAFDGWSMAPMVTDMGRAYQARCRNRAPDWVPLPVQYADYALWQRDWLGRESDPDSVLHRQLAYWRQELADVPELISLPTDRARPPAP